MLSGYTTRLAKDLMECRKHLRKNALHLIGPCLCIGVLSILAQWLKGGNLSLDAFWQITRTTADAYYWASGVSLPKHPAAGAVWFLFSLFWAKTCMDAISLCFSKKRIGIVFLSIGMLGLLLGWRGKWLPQNADVTMVAVLFVYLGMVWKEHAEIFDRYELGIFLSVSCVWLYCLRLGIYIEMAGRSYPYLSVSVLEAVCGTFVTCTLCKALEENEQINNLLAFIGRHTLLIFSMHCLDWIAVDAWMNHRMWIRNISAYGYGTWLFAFIL